MAVTPGFLGIDEPATIDKRADTNTMTRAATPVHREVVSIGSPDDATPESIAQVDSTGSLRTVSTDAAGTNQQAITAAGDAKVTLDGEINIVNIQNRQVGFEFDWLIDSSGEGHVNATIPNSPTRDMGKIDIVSLDQYTPVSGRLPVDGVGGTFPITAASLPLPTDAATETTLAARLDTTTFNTRIGSLTETAPATDTASSGLNGRLQRIAQRLTSLIALLPAALVGGRLDTNTGSWLGSTAPTVGSKTSANSVPVVVASDQGVIPVSDNASSLTVDQATAANLKAQVQGEDANDIPITGKPVLVAGRASAAAPADVSADGDAVSAWRLRNGAAAVVLTTPAGTVTGAALTVTDGGTETGALRVTIANNSTGLLSVDDNGGSLTVDLGPATAGGLTTFHLVSAASTNATNLKASAGQVYGWYIYNSNAAARKVAFHNTAGTPTAGASIFFSLVLPPGAAANVELTNGIAFSTGIAITTVTGLADSDSVAVAANDLVINIFFK